MRISFSLFEINLLSEMKILWYCRLNSTTISAALSCSIENKIQFGFASSPFIINQTLNKKPGRLFSLALRPREAPSPEARERTREPPVGGFPSERPSRRWGGLPRESPVNSQLENEIHSHFQLRIYHVRWGSAGRHFGKLNSRSKLAWIPFWATKRPEKIVEIDPSAPLNLR